MADMGIRHWPYCNGNHDPGTLILGVAGEDIPAGAYVTIDPNTGMVTQRREPGTPTRH